MRPLRIEMEGFMAYRQKAELDLTDAELFVLSGPTGSGKSSAIDAMVFALYGSTPRFGKGKVEPVLNSSADWGRVAFEFLLGEHRYRVARRVDRGKGVTEASLERDGKPLATGSREVGERVPQVIGLDYEQFTRAVVLPQGAFARFLRDTAGQRQDLLRALLDLQLFVRIKEMANQRAKVAEAAATSAAGRLADLEEVTPAMQEQAIARLEALRGAEGQLHERLQELSTAGLAVQELEKAAKEVADRIGALESIQVPRNVDDLASTSHAATSALEEAEAALKGALAVRDELLVQVEDHEELPVLTSWVESHTRLARLSSELATLDLDRLEVDATKAAKNLASAVEAYQTVHTKNVAHALRQGLSPGDVCPVCSQVVSEAPADDFEGDAALDDAQRAMGSARVAAEEARSIFNRAEGEAKRLTEQIEIVREQLRDAPDAKKTDSLLAEVTSLGLAIERAVSAAEEATSIRDRAKAGVDSVAVLGDRLKTELTTATARLESEGPPDPGSDAVAGWQSFREWREERLATLGELSSDLARNLAIGRNSLTEIEARFDTWMTDLELRIDADASTTLAVALTRQEQRVADLDKIAGLAAALTEQVKTETTKSAVAGSLGNHLKTNNFEEWVMEEAMRSLVIGANELLTSLSASRYALEFEDRGFEVVDRFNAGQRRSTDSLSGGETFLVSLALSLAMASQIAELSGSTSRLESIILDEGFDTLDPESLEVVGSVLDELVAQGRTVGIVTHVREFAERIPVQFAVVNGPDGATITWKDS